MTGSSLSQPDVTPKSAIGDAVPSAAFTPGPWRFIDATTEAAMQFRPMCVIKAGVKQIASFSWNNNSPWFPTKAESQANASLIAAAPELYEALAMSTAQLAASAISLRDAGRFADGDRAMAQCDFNRAILAKAQPLGADGTAAAPQPKMNP